MIEKTDPDAIQSYFEDPSNLRGGHADKVIIPQEEEELALILPKCNQEKIPVTISGAGTGLCGGRIPFGGIVISTEKLDKITKIERNTDRSSGTGIVQAGVTISNFKQAASKQNLMYAYDPTEQSAFIGGTVATNASGARSFKYGPTRKHVRRLRIILADGTPLNIKRGEFFACDRQFNVTTQENVKLNFPLPTYNMPQTKNASGYFVRDNMDLIDLFIGQEGTLGVITEIEVALQRKPENVLSCVVFFGSQEDALLFAIQARDATYESRQKIDNTGIDALSIEYFSKNCLKLLRKKNPHIPSGSQAAIFFEQETVLENEEKIAIKWQELIERYDVSPNNTWVAFAPDAQEKFTDFRHQLPELVNEKIKKNNMPKLGTDVAVPQKKLDEMIAFYLESINKVGLDSVTFGHIGESHLHTNFLPANRKELKKAKSLCSEFAKKAVSLGGTVSAEHGIGKTKHHYLKTLYGSKGLREMAALKRILDPNRILGRGNIFPEKLLEENCNF